MIAKLKRRLNTVIWLLSLVFFIADKPAAETTPHAGMVGLTASWQSGQTDIGFPVWASKKLVVTPSLSVVHVSNFATDVGFVLAVRINHGSDKAVPYYGIRAGALHRSPYEGKALTDYLVGGMFGGECFLQDHFSVGVEAQVNVVFSDERSYLFGNPNGTNINTAAAVMATFYF